MRTIAKRLVVIAVLIAFRITSYNVCYTKLLRNAFSGAGDPYLPFREIMDLLTGDVESRWSAGAFSTTQARRLWNARITSYNVCYTKLLR